MTRAQLKAFFRQVIVIVAGGPTDRTRGAGLLSLFDNFVDSATLPEDLDAAVNVRPWDATISDWGVNELATATVGGVSGFYRAKLAGGPFPLPTGPDDTYWHQEAPPVGTTTQYQGLSVPLAQGKKANDAVDTIRYRIFRPGLGDIDVFGLAADPVSGQPSGFSPQGWWRNGSTWEWVNYDVDTDTVSTTSSGLAPDQLDALNNANGPAAGNPFATLDDVAPRLLNSNNLSDLSNKPSARTNLGVAYGTTAGTVAQGNDSRLGDARNTTWAYVKALVSGGTALLAGAFAAGDTLEQFVGRVLYQFANLAGTILSTPLTGLSTSTATPVLATDSVLIGVGKAQGQINALGGFAYSATSGTGAVTIDLGNRRETNLTLTLSANTTLAFSNVVSGALVRLWVLENATGYYTLTPPVASLPAGALAINTAPSGFTLVTGTYNAGTATWGWVIETAIQDVYIDPAGTVATAVVALTFDGNNESSTLPTGSKSGTWFRLAGKRYECGRISTGVTGWSYTS